MFASVIALRWRSHYSNVDDYLYALQTRAYLDALGPDPRGLVDAWRAYGSNSPLVPMLALPLAAIDGSPRSLVLVQALPLLVVLLSVRSLLRDLLCGPRAAWLAAAASAEIGGRELWQVGTPGAAQARAALACDCAPPDTDALADRVVAAVGGRPVLLLRDDALLNANSLRYAALRRGAVADLMAPAADGTVTAAQLGRADYVVAGGTLGTYHPAVDQLALVLRLRAARFRVVLRRRLSALTASPSGPPRALRRARPPARNAGRRADDCAAMELSFANLLIIVAIGFAAPLALGFAPAVRVPSIVVEIVLGIVAGPAVLGWVEVDDPVRVLATVGLAFLLFLAGLEIDFQRLQGRVLRLTLVGFGASLAIALVAGLLLDAGGLVSQPLFVAIVLSATSLGVLVPVLKDAGESGSTFGQLIIASGTIADFATVILLSLFFSRESGSTATKVVLLAGLFLVAVALALAIAGVEHSRRLRETLRRLQDTTAQIRVRGAFVLLVGLVALAGELGLEVILGAFIAGAIISLVDRDREMTHAGFRRKLDAAGFGIFIPVFFVTTGVTYDLDALAGSASTLMHVPVFLAALVAVRGLPALLYRRVIPRDRIPVAMLMQATSLPFIVAATQVGLALGVVTPANAAALIAAGLLSVVVFPAASLALLRREPRMAAVIDAAMVERKAQHVGGLETA